MKYVKIVMAMTHERLKFGLFKAAVTGIASTILLSACDSASSNINAIDENLNNSPAISDVSIRVLSSRSDLVSGGDTLVEIVIPKSADVSELTVRSNRTVVTDSFNLSLDNRILGLVSGLEIGDNIIDAQLENGPVSTVTVTNYPSGGPLFSGPPLLPWTCTNQAAVDENCNQAPEYSFFYKSRSSNDLQPFDPDSPPDDIEETTTDQGVTVPFIVRQETGYQNRDQYKIAVLFQPEKPWINGTTPQQQFNRKLVINHGGSCGVEFQSGTAPDVLGGAGGLVSAPDSLASQYALSKGFAVMSTALSVSGHNCNVALQAESLVMAKERVIEQYGPLRYTIGQGCSGGSLAVQTIANAYPGIYDGILPTCTFPDAWSSVTQFVDTHLLLAYFSDPMKWDVGISWLPSQMADVIGHISIVNGQIGDSLQFDVIRPGLEKGPLTPCSGITKEQVYDAHMNPGGVRCSIQDAAINQLGPRSPEDWMQNEILAGRGFAGMPIDNVGVQYGLSVLRAGTISPAQFIDLNMKIGGLDVDANITPQRMVANYSSLKNAYRTGLINTASNLDRTALIDCAGPDPAAFHDAYRTYAVRARLEKEHGNYDNALIWEGPVAIQGDVYCDRNSFIAMDRWLAEVEKDVSNTPLAQKLTYNRPSNLGDRCYDGTGQQVSEGRCPDGVAPYYGTPRTVAGDSVATETNKCALRPLDRAADYGPLGFSNEQWAQMQKLFPLGVCDFTEPGVGQTKTIPWLTYQHVNGDVIYGGAPLPAIPLGSSGAGEAFRGF